MAVSHKSPFNCGKTFYANNWTGTPAHNPSGSIDWQDYGSDAINGETVRATAAGTAYFYNAGSTSYGKWVEIRHSDGTKTRYAHLATMVKSAGGSHDRQPGHHDRDRRLDGRRQRSPPALRTAHLLRRDGHQPDRGRRDRVLGPEEGHHEHQRLRWRPNPYTAERSAAAASPSSTRPPSTGGRTYLLYNSGNGTTASRR